MKYIEPPSKRRSKVITNIPKEKRSDGLVMRLVFALIAVCMILGLSHFLK